MFSTTVEFVSKYNNVNNLAQTGDNILLPLIFISIAVFCCISYLVIKHKFISKYFNNSANYYESNIKNNMCLKRVSIIIILFFSLSFLVSMFCICNKASASSTINLDIPNKITAYVDEYGNINIDDIILKNNDNQTVKFYSIAVNSNENKNINLNWNIKTDNRLIYSGLAGNNQDINPAIFVKSNDNISLNFNLNINDNEINNLIGSSYNILYSIDYSNTPSSIAQEPQVLNLTYNEKEQTGVLGNDTIKLYGQLSGIDAGTYKAYAVPTDNFTWEDGSTNEKLFEWKIDKATPILELDTYEIDVDLNQTKSIPFTFTGDGNLICKVEDEQVSTATIFNNNLIIEGKNSGSTDAEIKLSGTKNWNETTKRFGIYVSFNYTGCAYYRLSPLDKTNKKMNDLSFKWNPYSFLNCDNTKYNEDFCRLTAATNCDICLSGLIELDGVEHWTIDDDKSLYNVLGMRDIEDILINPDDYEYDKDDIASFVISHYCTSFNDNNKELIYVDLRGTTLLNGLDWFSNLDVGSEHGLYNPDDHPEWLDHDNHKGFDVTYRRIMKQILNYIDTYIDQNAEKTIVITGRSRGGALSELIGSEFENDSNYKSFTYSFFPPSPTTKKDVKYNTIFNIINDDDATPKLPLKKWGFNSIGTIKSVNIAKNTDYLDRWKDTIGFDYNECNGSKIEELFSKISKDRDSLYIKDPTLSPVINVSFDTQSDAENYINSCKEILKIYKLDNTLEYSIEIIDSKYYAQAHITPPFFMNFLSNILYFVAQNKMDEIVKLDNTLKELQFTWPDVYQEIISFMLIDIEGITGAHSSFASYIISDLQIFD